MRYGRCSRCGRPVSWQTGWSELLETRIGSGIESPNADPRSPSSGSKPDQWPHTAQRHDCWHNVPNRPNRHRDPERHGRKPWVDRRKEHKAPKGRHMRCAVPPRRGFVFSPWLSQGFARVARFTLGYYPTPLRGEDMNPVFDFTAFDFTTFDFMTFDSAISSA